MRPPGRLGKESERALLKTANKRTEQYVYEKHSVPVKTNRWSMRTKAFCFSRSFFVSMNTHMGLAALSYFGCFSALFESPVLLITFGVNS